MIAALLIGSLFRAPESRTSKAGKAFVTATLKMRDGDAVTFVRIVAFAGPAQAELLRLKDGDAVTVQGPLKAEIYERDGEHRVSLSIVADHILALRQPPKERKPKVSDPQPDTRSRQERRAGTWAPGAGPNDSIPFGGES